MTEQLKRHFINVLFRVKKIDVYCNQTNTLPFNEMAVLSKLLTNDCMDGNGMNTSDIHHHLYISKPAVSQILNSLEKKGYINRDIDPRDRRRIMVTVTPKAYEAAMAAKSAFDNRMNRIIAEFGEENMNILIKQLIALHEIFERIEKEENKNT